MRSELTSYLPMTIHHLNFIRIFVSLNYPSPPPPFIHFHFNKYFWILIIINCALTWSIKCTCDPYQILMRQLWIGSYLAVLLYISPSIIKIKKKKTKVVSDAFSTSFTFCYNAFYRHCMRILDSILMNNWYLWHQNVLMKK